MIKSNLSKKHNEKSFPKLVQNDSGTVVLMIKKTAGIVIHESGAGSVMGTYTDDYEGNGMFFDFEGEITLSNK